MGENNSKIFLVAIIAIVVIILISNNFNNLTGNVARNAIGGLDYCKNNRACNVGEGDCDSDVNKKIIDCKSGLVCKSNVGANYGWAKTTDVCEIPTTTKTTKKEPKCTVGGYRCEKDSSGQYTGWAQKCYDSLIGWENAEYCKNGCDGNTGQCITIEEVTRVYDMKSDGIPLGSSFVESLADDNGVLKTYEGLKVETSLTAAEDDYQTDIVMEAAKDSIKYYSNIEYPLPGKTFYFLGNSIKVESSRADSMIAQINGIGIRKTIKDGDAFIGENLNDPNWVWDLNGLISGNPNIAIENDFIWNDHSDNPAKVGECIYLPNNYAKVCLDSLNVKENEYRPYTIEYNSLEDLSDAGAGSSEKTIRIKATKKGGISLSGGPSTNYIWITGDGRVYYKDISTNKVKYWKKVVQTNSPQDTLGTINNDLNLFVNPYTENIYVGISPVDLREALLTRFSVVDGEVQGLGKTRFHEEADELTWEFNGKITSIGNKDEDHRTAYGIIVRDPKSHGATDEVVLDISSKQVKAEVSMRFNAATAKCTDSDGGLDYYIKGRAKSDVRYLEDYCDSSMPGGYDLNEYYCITENSASNRWYKCPNGCNDGACIKETIKETIRSDFNSNGCVDFSDFALFNHFYGKKSGDSEYNSKYDLNSDGKIDNSDFVLFAADYGKGCPIT